MLLRLSWDVLGRAHCDCGADGREAAATGAAVSISHFLFLLGHVALQHLVRLSIEHQTIFPLVMLTLVVLQHCFDCMPARHHKAAKLVACLPVTRSRTLATHASRLFQTYDRTALAREWVPSLQKQVHHCCIEPRPAGLMHACTRAGAHGGSGETHS